MRTPIKGKYIDYDFCNTLFKIKQGDAYPIHFVLTDDSGQKIVPPTTEENDIEVFDVAITIGGITKKYSDGGVTYFDDEQGHSAWQYNMTQNDSYAFKHGRNKVEAMVKFNNFEILNQRLEDVIVIPSDSKVIL